MTTMSIRIASRFRAVSTRVSPLMTLEPDAATFTVSAESLFSANSKEILVRVELSKKRLTIVEPRRAGTFLIARSLISLNGSAVSRMRSICSLDNGSRPRRSLPSRLVTAPLPRLEERFRQQCGRPTRRSERLRDHPAGCRHACRLYRREWEARARHDRRERQAISEPVFQNRQARRVLPGRCAPCRE